MKEVILFTYGDSADVSTWSNVPFLFSTTLEKKGVLVHRIDISGPKFLHSLYRKIVVRILRIFYPGHIYVFMRTRWFASMVNRKIKKAVKKYSNSDICIFLNFDFYNKFNQIPTMLFGDWTYNILILERLSRNPYFFESRFSKQQAEAINNAKLVISLFPESADSMRNEYPQANIHYLGTNVVNSLYKGKIVESDIIRIKQESKNILFIGGRNYLDGAETLVHAFKLFLNHHSDFTLHLIGIKKEWITEDMPDQVKCYGYLHKDIENERNKYYELVFNAHFIINPTPIWAGYSSTIEAMYFYTPVITTPYKDFVKEFGKEIDFGVYINDYSVNGVCKAMCSFIEQKKYASLCKSAHLHVEDYNWDTYIDKIFSLLSE